MTAIKYKGMTSLFLFCLFISILDVTESKSICFIRRWRMCTKNRAEPRKSGQRDTIIVVPKAALDYEQQDNVDSSDAHEDEILDSVIKVDKPKKRYSNIAEFYVETRDSPITILPEDVKNISVPKMPVSFDPKEVVVSKKTPSEWREIPKTMEDEITDNMLKDGDGDKRLFLLEVGVLPLPDEQSEVQSDEREHKPIAQKQPNMSKVIATKDEETRNTVEEKVLPVISDQIIDETNNIKGVKKQDEEVDALDNIEIIPLSEILKQYRVKRKVSSN